jgi:hypothetical protein
VKKIEFHGSSEALRSFPRPFPAAKGIPAWLKQMPLDRGGADDQPMLKRCPPFLEAMTAGYLIPLAADCRFIVDEDGLLRIESRLKLVTAHPPFQYEGAPFAAAPVVKFINPWIIRTPQGCSTLFVGALNRYELPFAFFSGVVETDAYYRGIHFPAICTLRPGSDFLLQAGTPLVQAIPIERQRWTAEFVDTDETRRDQVESQFTADRHTYKAEFWKGGEYL